jgi:putative endonuclease
MSPPVLARAMSDQRSYWIYMMASQKNGTLYIGVTNGLERRVWQHKNEVSDGFTKQYRVTRLVYFEAFNDISAAIGREKQLKAGTRKKKIALIESNNPEWADLSADWFDEVRGPYAKKAAE